MKTRSLRAAVLFAVLIAGTALAWNREYAWYDPAAPTAAGKPGAGGVFGTGSRYEGGIECQHCHTPVDNNPANPLRVLVTFSPPMSGAPGWDGGVNGFVVNGGRYALNTNYAVNVRMLNEHLLSPDGGPHDNNFAGLFEDGNGVRVGAMTTDTGIDAGNCPVNVPVAPTTGTTHMYRRCDVMFSRYPAAGLTSWNLSWRSPATGSRSLRWAGSTPARASRWRRHETCVR